MDRRQDRGQETRGRIVAISTRLFTDNGYEAVSIEAILRACEISRGALYHHFSSKEAVFTAVLHTVEAQIAERLAQAASGAADPLSALRAGCEAWLRLAETDAAVRRVVLIDAPSVIGWDAWRAMDEQYSLGLLRSGLQAAAAAGALAPERVGLTAHMLLAVLVEVALLIARAPDDHTGAAAARDAVAHFIGALLTSSAGSAGTLRSDLQAL